MEPERKRKKSVGSSKKEEEDNVDVIYDKLCSRHNNTFSVPQLRLWARKIHCGTYADYEVPPRVPMTTGSLPTHHKSNSLTDALTGAAEAVAKVFAPKASPAQPSSSLASGIASTIGISPSKSTELRMKNLEQLRVLHQLHQENIITDKELVEQKMITLRKLSCMKAELFINVSFYLTQFFTLTINCLSY